MENNFDFLVGTWTSRQRRLRKVLVGSEDWYEFDGFTNCWSIFDGAGNIDEVRLPEIGVTGLTVRLYDAGTDLWSLYWGTAAKGLSPVPVVGRFGPDDRGVFTGDDVYEGH